MTRLSNNEWKVEYSEVELFRGTEAACEAFCKTYGFRFNRWICQRTLVLC